MKRNSGAVFDKAFQVIDIAVERDDLQAENEALKAQLADWRKLVPAEHITQGNRFIEPVVARTISDVVSWFEGLAAQFGIPPYPYLGSMGSGSNLEARLEDEWEAKWGKHPIVVAMRSIGGSMDAFKRYVTK